MVLKSKEELSYLLHTLKPLSFGSQGECFLDSKTNLVYKLYFDYEGEEDYATSYREEEITRFSNIHNKTFIWPIDVIWLEDKIIGYITKYKKAENLYKLNPLSVNLDTLIHAIIDAYKDISIISNNGVLTFDVPYNMLFNKKLYVLDSDDYSLNDLDPKLLEEKNKRNFNYEIYLFLINSVLDKLVLSKPLLKEMYSEKNIDLVLFIELLKKEISELVGQEITYLREAKKYITMPKSDLTYVRELKNRIDY